MNKNSADTNMSSFEKHLNEFRETKEAAKNKQIEGNLNLDDDPYEQIEKLEIEQLERRNQQLEDQVMRLIDQLEKKEKSHQIEIESLTQQFKLIKQNNDELISELRDEQTEVGRLKLEIEKQHGVSQLLYQALRFWSSQNRISQYTELLESEVEKYKDLNDKAHKEAMMWMEFHDRANDEVADLKKQVSLLEREKEDLQKSIDYANQRFNRDTNLIKLLSAENQKYQKLYFSLLSEFDKLKEKFDAI